MINRNGHRDFPPASPHTTCSGCGEPVDIENADTLIEMTEDQWSRDGNRIAWHQDCFNHFLDEGEET